MTIALGGRGGRPLRFLGVTLGGWVVLRVGMLWPTIDVPRDLIRVLAPPVLAKAEPRTRVAFAARAASARVAAVRAVIAEPGVAASIPISRPRHAVDPARVALAMASFLSFGREVPTGQAGAIPPPLRPTPVDARRRLTGSLWGIARQGVDAALPGGQLGGSQAGVRVVYALGDARRVALAARLSAPLQGRGAEMAVGVDYRLPGSSLHLIAERRFSLEGGRGGTAIYAVGGLAPTPVAAGFRLESYAQAGIVRSDAFADGAARLTRAVADGIDVGVGAWGGAQPGVARVDVGPTIGVALPVAGQRLRVSLDWRQRVAGQARPGSGPALSIGSDF